MRLLCVGIGPGGGSDMTSAAREALADAEVIVGYTTYIELIRNEFEQADYIATPMRTEERRCRCALELAAAGKKVCVVCSGDPGVYGMAALLIELAPQYGSVEVGVVSGVTAALSGAALLGAPLSNDWCSVSLSDLMTPWEVIERRLIAAASAGFCICLYNPASHGRKDHLKRACDVLLGVLDKNTVCGVARKVGRAGEQTCVLSLLELRSYPADMLTCVFVGNETTREVGGRMCTPRGYRLGGA